MNGVNTFAEQPEWAQVIYATAIDRLGSREPQKDSFRLENLLLSRGNSAIASSKLSIVLFQAKYCDWLKVSRCDERSTFTID